MFFVDSWTGCVIHFPIMYNVYGLKGQIADLDCQVSDLTRKMVIPWVHLHVPIKLEDLQRRSYSMHTLGSVHTARH